jgi:adenylate cyclase
MENYKIYRFKTLQGRMITLLLIPIFLIIFSGGVTTFFYTRNAIVNQWNESAVLKLQRASHYLEMRLLKPVELLELLIQISQEKRMPLTPGDIVQHLEALEGIVQVDFIAPIKNDTVMNNQTMGHHGMMNFGHSKILKISDPEYDTDNGFQTVTFLLKLFDLNKQTMGTLNVKMSFNYLLKDIIKLGWWQSDMACIVDGNGKYMAHTNMDMKGRNYLGGENDPLESEVLKQIKIKSHGTVKSSETPPKMIAGFYKLEQVPWTIILFAQRKKILDPIIKYRNTFAFGSFILVFVILLLIKSHVGKIVNKIQNLSTNAQAVAQGKYGLPIKVESKDEIGQLVHNYNNMVKGLEERDFIRDSFGRYVDPEFAKYLLKHPDASELGGKRRDVSIMMSDIRGFTALSETLSPEIIINILNQYFSHMISIIQKYNGIIVDFFGDSILVFFDPLSSSIEDTAFKCIDCASEMQYQMEAFNKKMHKKGLPNLGMGIGINAGPVIVGNIGSESRTKYGVVGSTVNITSRIQAKANKHEIVISDTAYQIVKNHVTVENQFPAVLKGVDSPMKLRIIIRN